jgi:carbamoyltransferase
VVCFLTTGLHYLVVGNYLVSKADLGPSCILDLCVSLPAYARLTQTMALGNDGDFELTYTIANSYDRNSIPISKEAYQILIHSGKRQRLNKHLKADSESSSAIVEELWSLWEKRAVILHPLDTVPAPAGT